MALLTITINDPVPAFDKKSAEIQYFHRVFDTLVKEIAGKRGTVTSGTIIGQSAGGLQTQHLVLGLTRPRRQIHRI